MTRTILGGLMAMMLMRDLGTDNAGGNAPADDGTDTNAIPAGTGTTTDTDTNTAATTGNDTDTDTGTTIPAEPLTLKDQIKGSFAKLTSGDQAANVITESEKLITELNGLSFGTVSTTTSWIMQAQITEAVKAVEVATKETLDSIS